MSAAEFKQEVTKLLTKYPEESMLREMEDEFFDLRTRVIEELVEAEDSLPEGDRLPITLTALYDMADDIDCALWDVEFETMTWKEFKQYVEDYPV